MFAPEIEKLEERGWLIYRATDTSRLEDVVAEGPAKDLEVGVKYLILPKVVDPRNLVAMKEEIGRMLKSGPTPLVSLFVAVDSGIIVKWINGDVRYSTEEFGAMLDRFPLYGVVGPQ